MHGKSDVAARNPRATATKEQLRLAEVTQSDTLDEDRSRIQKYIKEIVETTRCSPSQAEIALHDAGNNVEAAVNQILESTNPETWTHQKRKGPKNKEAGEEEDTFKKPGSRPARRGPFNGNSKFVGGNGPRDGARDGPREGPRGGAEGRENRQPRGPPKEGGGFRRDRDQPNRPPRRDFPKRDNNDWTKNVQRNADTKEEEEDLWGGETLVFNRRENVEPQQQQQPAAQKPAPVEEQPKAAPPTAPPAKPCAAGPLSFAEVVRKNAQKAAPHPPPPAAEPVVPPSESRPTPSNEKQPFAESQSSKRSVSPPPAEALPPPGMHLTSEGPSGGHDEKAPSPHPSHPPSADEKVQQQLTDKLKNDLGLPASSATAAFPAQNNLQQAPFSNKPAAVKAGVVEFCSGELPASSNEFQFGFEAAPPMPQHSLMDDRFQHVQPEALPKVPEATRSEPDVLSAQPAESSAPRQNAAAVLNQYVQQPQHQAVQPPQAQQQHLPYAHQQSQQSNQYGRNRNGANQQSAFNDNYRDVNSFSDHRNYGPPSSPPKSQNLQQSMQSSQQQQQLPQSQAQQPTHHPQQHIYQPPQLPYNFQYMYSPVPPPAGMRDDFANLMPYQFNLNQMDLNPLAMMSQLAVTSAGPLPGHQPQQHHQATHHQQNLQQHGQNAHSGHGQQRDSTWLGNQLPPASQNNQPNGHGSQGNSNLNSSQQQRQSMVDNNSQNILGGSGIQPPPGFPNMPAAAQYRPPQVFTAYPPYNMGGFPFVIPQNKPKP